MASWLPAVTSLIAGVAGRKPDLGTGFGEDNHGAAEWAAMFAQMRICMDYCTEPATGSKQPASPDRRCSPPTELIGGGSCGPSSGRPGHAPRQGCKSPPLPGLQSIGDFCRFDPLARKEATKEASCCRSSPRDRRCLGSKCYPALPKLQLHAALERQSERGSPFMAPCSAGLPCSLLSHQA
jgi:hypothetical protein